MGGGSGSAVAEGLVMLEILRHNNFKGANGPQTATKYPHLPLQTTVVGHAREVEDH